MESEKLKYIVEAALLASDEPLTRNQLAALFPEDEAPSHKDISIALGELSDDYEPRGIQLTEVASGFRLQIDSWAEPWISGLWRERPPRYSRALLETLALIAYRQPITRGEIEKVRGVSVSSNIMRTLVEREWVRVIGHRDVPGRPAIYGTNKAFLDYFGLKSLDDLPTLAEIRDIEAEPELDLEGTLRDAAAAAAEQLAADNDQLEGEPPPNAETDQNHGELSTQDDGPQGQDDTESGEEADGQRPESQGDDAAQADFDNGSEQPEWDSEEEDDAEIGHADRQHDDEPDRVESDQVERGAQNEVGPDAESSDDRDQVEAEASGQDAEESKRENQQA